MNDTVRKSVITKNLRNWYVTDSIFFNGHAKNVIKEAAVFQEYVTLKGAMLANLFEYYDVIGYTPSETTSPNNVNVLQEQAAKLALKCKAIASKTLNSEAIKKNISKQVMTESKKYKNADQTKITDKVIQEKFIQVSLDNALIGIPLMESKTINESTKFKAKILEESHKIIRDSLIKLALTCKKK